MLVGGVDVAFEQHLGVGPAVICREVVGQHPQFKPAGVGPHLHERGRRGEQGAALFPVLAPCRDLREVRGVVGAASGDGPVGDDPAVDAPVRADHLEPAVLPFRQHPDDLQKFEVVHERLAFGERQAGEHILIHFGLPRVREFGRLPAVFLHEAVGYLLP